MNNAIEWQYKISRAKKMQDSPTYEVMPYSQQNFLSGFSTFT